MYELQLSGSMIDHLSRPQSQAQFIALYSSLAAAAASLPTKLAMTSSPKLGLSTSE